MSQRSGSKPASRQPDHAANRRATVEGSAKARQCPWCGSNDTQYVQRGFAGGGASRDQYFTCGNCGKTTYEIISRTDRDLRLHRSQPGGIYRDAEHQTRYRIFRMLRIGFNEHLLYLRPEVDDEA